MLLILKSIIFYSAEDVNTQYHTLKDCEEAIDIVYQMEKKLYDDNVISLAKLIKSSSKDVEVYTNKSFIQLEATFPEMASYPNLCKGIMYMLHMVLDGKHIVRYLISYALISKILKETLFISITTN